MALCAHELAHLARRDPAWILLARLVEAAGARPAAQRLGAPPPARTSPSASATTSRSPPPARPLGLARSLVDVASWTLGERPFFPWRPRARSAPAAASAIAWRDSWTPPAPLERPRRLLLPAAALVVLATALVTPVVSGSAVPPPAPPAPQADAVAGPAGRGHAARPGRARPDRADGPGRQIRAASKATAASRAEAASNADAASKADAEERLEALGRQIEERARLHEADMKTLEAEIEAIASKMQPARGRAWSAGPARWRRRPEASPSR